MYNDEYFYGITDLMHFNVYASLLKEHKVDFIKVKGHADNENNNRCDKLARQEIKKFQE